MQPANFILLAVFVIGTILDLVFAVLGAGVILQPSNFLGYVIVVAPAVAQVGIRLSNRAATRQQKIDPWLRYMFFVSVIFDFAIVGVALIAYVLLKKPLSAQTSIDWAQVNAQAVSLKLVVAIILFYLTASPIMLSGLFKDYL